MSIRIDLTVKEMERFLKELGLYSVYNDLMYPINPIREEGELAPVLKKAYSQLKELYEKSCNHRMRSIASKSKQKFLFKDEAEFEKEFSEFFEKRLIAAYFKEFAKHPNYNKKQVAKNVEKKAAELFDQTVAYGFNYWECYIREQKIAHGEWPLDL